MRPEERDAGATERQKGRRPYQQRPVSASGRRPAMLTAWPSLANIGWGSRTPANRGLL